MYEPRKVKTGHLSNLIFIIFMSSNIGSGNPADNASKHSGGRSQIKAKKGVH